MGSSPPILLSYSSPQVFFEGTCRTRTVWTLLMAGLLAVVGVSLVSWWPLRSPFVGLALACLLLSAWCVVAPWVLGSSIPVRITADGIEFGRQFLDWRHVSRLGVCLYNGDRVEMFVDSTACFPPRQSLPTTPLLRLPQYDRLATELRTYLAEHHPHVYVEALQ